MCRSLIDFRRIGWNGWETGFVVQGRRSCRWRCSNEKFWCIFFAAIKKAQWEKAFACCWDWMVKLLRCLHRFSINFGIGQMPAMTPSAPANFARAPGEEADIRLLDWNFESLLRLGVSPIIIYTENGCIWKVTPIGDKPTFNFHDYGKGSVSAHVIHDTTNVEKFGCFISGLSASHGGESVTFWDEDMAWNHGSNNFIHRNEHNPLKKPWQVFYNLPFFVAVVEEWKAYTPEN